eukprot:3491131-Amphidinium_carterae.1
MQALGSADSFGPMDVVLDGERTFLHGDQTNRVSEGCEPNDLQSTSAVAASLLQQLLMCTYLSPLPNAFMLKILRGILFLAS